MFIPSETIWALRASPRFYPPGHLQGAQAQPRGPGRVSGPSSSASVAGVGQRGGGARTPQGPRLLGVVSCVWKTPLPTVLLRGRPLRLHPFLCPSRTMCLNGPETTVPTTSSQKPTRILTIPAVAFSSRTWAGCLCANTLRSSRRALCWTCQTSKPRNW